MSIRQQEFATKFAESYPDIALSFQRIVRSAYGMIDPDFRMVRPEITKLKPPILVCDAEALDRFSKPVFDDSPYTDHEKGDIFFDAGSGVIFASDNRIAELLKKGKQGEAELQLIFLEEFLHAYTTFPDFGDTKHLIRIGCVKTPLTRSWHTLLPGYIYSYDIARQMEQVVEKGTQLDSEHLHITEHLTRYLAWNFLSKHVIQAKHPEYNHIVMVHKGFNKSTHFLRCLPFDQKHVDSAIRILLSGNTTAGGATWPQSSIEALSKPEMSMYPSKPFPTSGDELFDFDMLN